MIEAPERRAGPAPPAEHGPLGAVWMRCCQAWEEDENAVDYRTVSAAGYRHWGPAECRVPKR